MRTRPAVIIKCIVTAFLFFGVGLAQASHFRGAAMVPEVDASGVLTIRTASFWRKGNPNTPSPVVTGPGVAGISASFVSAVDDDGDPSLTIRNSVHTLQLPAGGGTYTIVWNSFNRILGIQNANASRWQMDSVIVWDGASAIRPITFGFSALSPEVVRAQNYNGNLGAVPALALTLTYDQALNLNINSQPPGFVINTTTGALFIPAANTTTYLDNSNNASVGGDYAFSGNIFASDGSSVEFDWMFDAVDVGSNLSPSVDDAAVAGNVGDVISHTFTGADPNAGDTLTWSFVSLTGPGSGAPAIAPTFDVNTQQFSWNTAGSAAGIWQVQVRLTDQGGLTDIGILNITLAKVVAVPVPVPTLSEWSIMLLVISLALAAFIYIRRINTLRP